MLQSVIFLGVRTLSWLCLWLRLLHLSMSVHAFGHLPSSFLFHRFFSTVQGVPKKTVFSVQTVIEGIRNELGIKVGGVSENSGYFLSNEYKNSTISRKKS